MKIERRDRAVLRAYRKSGRVLGDHAQQRPAAGARADGDAHRVQDRLRPQRQLGEVHGGQLVHPLAGLRQALRPAPFQQEHRFPQQGPQAGLPRLQRLALADEPGEVVDDPTAA